ncbi:MAG TPA: hypothetical protein VMT85_10450 [Thermoanaerobaculia bacterium]|nr:hypothetical protein [Thermoanaerobaculia bacterium]
MATRSTSTTRQKSSGKTTEKTTGKTRAKTAKSTGATAPGRRLRVPARVLELQKRAIERQRSAFDTTFSAIQSFEEGRESAIHNLLASSALVPKEWRLMAEAWIENARQGREGFRQTVDTSFGLVDQLVDRLGEEAPAEA